MKVVLDLATKESRIKRRRARARRFSHLRQAFPLRQNEDAPSGNNLYKRFYCLFAGASISSRRDSLATFPVISVPIRAVRAVLFGFRVGRLSGRIFRRRRVAGASRELERSFDVSVSDARFSCTEEIGLRFHIFPNKSTTQTRFGRCDVSHVESTSGKYRVIRQKKKPHKKMGHSLSLILLLL